MSTCVQYPSGRFFPHKTWIMDNMKCTLVSWCRGEQNPGIDRKRESRVAKVKDKTEKDKQTWEQRGRMEEECSMVGKHCIICFVGLQVWSVVWSAGHRQDIYTLCLAHKSCHMAERTDTASILAPTKLYSMWPTLLSHTHAHTHTEYRINIICALMQTWT